MALHVVIMAGGKGERLWPLSKRDMPKQLISFDGKKSLLRRTFDRTLQFVQEDHIYVVTNKDIADKVGDHLPGMPKENILVEPVGRNTAPCIGYAAMVISAKDPDATMAVFPSDHIVSDPANFVEAVGFGTKALERYPELLITIGMIPDHPETGYGYIAPGGVIIKNQGHVLHKVDTFHEKPDKISAEAYIENGFLWNAGMFLWRVDTILERLEQYLPELFNGLVKIRSPYGIDHSALNDFYVNTLPISIDYGIMEKADSVAVIPVEFGWNDIGSWDAIGKMLPKDEKGNVIKGSVLMEDSCNNVVWSTNKKIVLIDVRDLVVVEGEDAILICTRERSQDVSKAAKLVAG